MADENKAASSENQEKRPVLESAVTLTGARKKHHPVRTAIISGCVVALLCGAGYYAANALKPEEVIPEATEAPSYATTLYSYESADIASVDVQNESGTYTLLQDAEGKYTVDGMDFFTCDQSAAKAIFNRGLTFTTQSTAAEKPEDLQQFGLDKPAAVLTYHHKDGKTVTLKLGNRTPLTYYYMMVDGDPNVYTIYATAADSFNVTLNSLHTIAPVAAFGEDTPSYIYLERPQGSYVTPTDGASSQLVLGDMFGGMAGDPFSVGLPLGNTAPESEAPAEPEAANDAEAVPATEGETVPATEEPTLPEPTIIEISTLAEGEVTVSISSYKLRRPFEYDCDSEKLDALLGNIMSVQLTAYAGHISTPEDAAAFGMDNPIILKASNDSGVEASYRIGAKADATTSYITVDETGDVYTIASNLVDFARELTVSGIVDRFANIINIAKVDSLDVTAGGVTNTLSIERFPEYEEDGVTIKQKNGKDVINEVYYFNGAEVAEKPFKKLYQAVIGPLVNGVTEDYDMTGEPVLTITYHLNIEPATVEVNYIELDRNYYAVQRDGHTYFYINRATIDDVITQITTYDPEAVE